MTFMDDYTRMFWLYFLNHKSDVFAIFRRFKAMVELQSGYQIKKLRSDKGGNIPLWSFKGFVMIWDLRQLMWPILLNRKELLRGRLEPL